MSIQSQTRLMRKRVLIPASQFNVQQLAIAPILTMTDGSTMFAYSPGGGDIKGASVFTEGTHEEADQAAGPVNSALLFTAQTFTSIGEGGLLDNLSVQPDVGRNLTFTIENPTGGALDLADAPDTEFVIVGTFRGAAQNETVTFNVETAAKSVAAAKFRWFASTKPFDSITTITCNNIGAGALTVAVGPGTKIGYPINSDTGADADFLTASGGKVTLNAADFDPTGVIDHTNKTITFTVLADGADVGMVYTIDYDGAAGTIAAFAAETLIASPGAGNALLKNINSSGKMGFLMETGDLCMCSLPLGDVDHGHPIRVRTIYATASTTTTETTSWIALYLAKILGTTAIVVPATGLDTAITTLDANAATANAEQASAWGVINGVTLGNTVETLDLSIELDAETITGNIYLTALEVEYTPRITRQGQPLEAEAWTAV